MLASKTLPIDLSPRRYTLMKLKGVNRVLCQVNGEWIMDTTCKSLNELLDNGLVCEESISSWISLQCFTFH
jgi:hypothetical protein